MSVKPFRMLAAAASAAGFIVYARYRQELESLRESVDQGSTIAETPQGDIEYAEAGDGEPMLVIHGAGGGYDQGLMSASDFGGRNRVICPSRFGYLKTPAPNDYSRAAQADAHAALLHFLGIRRTIVVGASAGDQGERKALLPDDRADASILGLAGRADGGNILRAGGKCHAFGALDHQDFGTAHGIPCDDQCGGRDRRVGHAPRLTCRRRSAPARRSGSHYCPCWR